MIYTHTHTHTYTDERISTIFANLRIFAESIEKMRLGDILSTCLTLNTQILDHFTAKTVKNQLAIDAELHKFMKILLRKIDKCGQHQCLPLWTKNASAALVAKINQWRR